MNEEQAQRRRRASYRAHHRGTQEMDLLLGRYAEEKLAGMSEQELAAFEQFMDLPDQDLQRALMAPTRDGMETVAKERNLSAKTRTLVLTIRAFHGLDDGGGRKTVDRG